MQCILNSGKPAVKPLQWLACCEAYTVLSLHLRMSVCRVCTSVTDKTRIHYGGISCYPCRQFFRRITTAGEQKTCQWGRECVVNQSEQRMCQACRYQKCLAIGMRTDLVLDTEGRSKRFRKLEVDKGEIASMEPENSSGRKTLWEVSDESSDDGFDFHFVRDCQEYTLNESLLDPETGLVIRSTKTPDKDYDMLSYEVSDIKEDTISHKRKLELMMSYRKPNETVKSEIIHNRHDGVLAEDSQILHYIHKKFRKKKDINDLESTLMPDDSIVGVVLLPQSEYGADLEVCLRRSIAKMGDTER